MKITLQKIIYIVMTLIVSLDIVWAYYFYLPITPFPENEFLFKAINSVLRDILLFALIYFLYINKYRIPDRLKRYFPVTVIGVLYLVAAAFMIYYISLDFAVLTLLSLLTGIINNIVIVLLTSIMYFHWPNRFFKAVYFVTYFLTALCIGIDVVYFSQTSTHVQSILFDNINIYATKGVLSSLSVWQFLVAFAVIAVLIVLFRLPKLTKRKPNFVYSLLGVAVFFIVFNLANRSLSFIGHYCIDQVTGLGLEVTIEKTRQEYRDMLSTPINVNFVTKGLFNQEKILRQPEKQQKYTLTQADMDNLASLNIYPEEKPQPVTAKPAYKRVIILVTESVHRDYFHFYNKKIPAVATEFIDNLFSTYPRIDNYYASSIPTTQGLNATLRSQYLYDPQGPGAQTASLFRQVAAAGYRDVFLSASSKYYSNELREYPTNFGMREYYPKEYLEARGYKGASGWGYHNDVLYQEGLEILRKAKQNDEKLFMLVKTLDMHQPYPYYGITYANLPPEVRDSKYATVRGIYWENKCLEDFITTARREKILDNETLIIFTSDHNPHSGGEYKELVENQNAASIAPIPLLFISPNLTPLDKLSTNLYAGQVDLAPTILNLLGITPSDQYLGRSMLGRKASQGFAVGYFGGKVYYFSPDKNFTIRLDEPYPTDAVADSLAKYILHTYTSY